MKQNKARENHYSSKPHVIYIVKLECAGQSCIGYGCTSRLRPRLGDHRTNVGEFGGTVELLKAYVFPNGASARRVEYQLTKLFMRSHLFLPGFVRESADVGCLDRMNSFILEEEGKPIPHPKPLKPRKQIRSENNESGEIQIRINLRLTEETSTSLAAIAKKADVSMSVLVRVAVRDHLLANEPFDQPDDVAKTMYVLDYETLTALKAKAAAENVPFDEAFRQIVTKYVQKHAETLSSI
jgi:hypothetical protein